MAEIKKAKAQEKAQKKADRALARIDKYNKITTGEAKAPVKAKRAPAAKGKRGQGKGAKTRGSGRDGDVMDSDDSLNDFVVNDDEEIETYGRKKRRQ